MNITSPWIKRLALLKITIFFTINLFFITPLVTVFAQEVDLVAQDVSVSSVEQLLVPDSSGGTIIDSDIETLTMQDEKDISSDDNLVKEPKEEDLEQLGKEKLLAQQQMALMVGSVNSPGNLMTIANSKLNLSPNIDDTNGALTYKYKINLPPGRNGLAPDIALTYNSLEATSESVVGSGWSTNIPYIYRINKTGSSNLYSTNYYYSSLDGELVSIGSGNYTAKVEKGDFRKYSLISNVWTVTDKNGTLFKFGTTASSRQDDPSDSTRIFKWMLEETRDTNDNYISYTYYKDAGQIYPSQVVYTGNGSTAGALEVNFDRSIRSGAPEFFNTGFSVKSNYRITEIRTEINNVWARKYTLAYTTGDNGYGSLLNTIIESGQDDFNTVVTLPAVDFDYQASTPGWAYNSSWTMPSGIPFASPDSGARMADINGDGLLDYLCHNSTTVSPICSKNDPRIYLNNGDGTWTNVSSTWLFPLIGGTGSDRESFRTTSQGGVDLGLRVIDVNGDGLPDLIRNKDNTPTYVYLNNGSGWTYNSSWSIPSAAPFSDGVDTGLRMADINGDGLPDYLCHNSTTNSTWCSKNNPLIYLNNGDGTWTNVSSTWLFPLIGGTGSDRESFLNSSQGGVDLGLRTVDINGDGLTDLVKSKDNTPIYVYLNNGSGWTYNSSWTMPSGIPFASPDSGARMADINGDGLPDFICHNSTTSSPLCSKNNPYTAINNGDGTWTNVSSTWLFPLIGGSGSDSESFFTTSQGGVDLGLRTVDINGDGLTDLVKSKDNTPIYVYLNSGAGQANLIKKITYAQGGDTTITYKATPLFKSSGVLLNPSLPLVNDVVYQMVTNDGSGIAESLTYEYEGGKYYYNNALDRKFAGFNSVKVTDAGGNYKKTYYYQGDNTNTTMGEYNDHVAKIGIPYRVEEYDNVGNLYRLAVDKVDRYNIGTDHDFVKVIRRTILDYDGNGGHKDTSVEYTYDDVIGNLLTITEWGEVIGSNDGLFTDTGSDKRITTYVYASNGTTFVNVPYNETITDGSSNKIKENKYYYDAQPYGSVTKGNQTKIEQWIIGSTYINSQKTYNSTYGYVATTTDPRGKVTTYTTYDSYNIYPTIITDPLGQTLQYTYDYSLGKPKQTTNQNGFVYDTVYDGLDRVKAEKIPDFTNPYSGVIKTSYIYTDTFGDVKVQRRDYFDSSIIVDTYQYFDGIGRLIQERKEAESNYNVKDKVYNNIGLVQKQSLPYSSNGSSKTSPTSTTSLYTTYTYDPLQRVLIAIDAVGTMAYTYDDWKTIVTDRNNKVKRYYKNAYNNLIKVDEINGGSTYTTNYEYNLNNKLTKITDALNNVRNFTYDGLGRRLTAQDLHASADGSYGTWTYVYDNTGNLTQTVSPRSLTTNYTYNDINQVLTEDYTGAGGTEIIYTYGGCINGVEKLCSVTMTTGANSTYTYDSNGNLASESKTINATTYTTSYTYNRQANKLVITYPDSAQIKYTFNSAGLLDKIERKESGGVFSDVISNFDYSPMDQVTTQVFPNTVTTTNTYDANVLYRLSRRLTQNIIPTKFQDLNYTYDNNGNITQIIDASNTNSSKTVNYTYDDLNRLLSATTTNVAGGQSTYIQNFTYNALGNITSGPIGSYTYAGTGYANPHAATTINGVTYTYDNDGNLTGNGTLANTWNYKNQLIQSVVGGTTNTYIYDYAGERASNSDGTITTIYPNDFYNANGTKKTKSIYAGDQLVATVETISGTVTPYYIHTDNLGSVTATSDSSGVLSTTLDYFPYGNQRISSGAHTEQRQYIGQMYDANTGLDYLNARYYEGLRGQFISEDPSHLAISDPGKVKALTGMDMQNYLADPQQLNSYSYARNNPIVNSDPTGNATYIWNNGAGMSGIDTWDTNTYYQSQDQALLQNNAAVMSSLGNYANLGAFYDRVRNGAEWDYKNQGRSYYFYGDDVVNKETFGNRNYGYAGTAAGFGKTLLKGAAGYAQVRSGNAQLKDARTYFDDPKDTVNIQIGISSYNGSNKGNPASLFQIGVQTTTNSKALNSIYRQLQSIQKQINSLTKKLGR